MALQAMSVHGNAVRALDRTIDESARREPAGSTFFSGSEFGCAFSAAIPTPVQIDGNRPRLSAVFIGYRTSGGVLLGNVAVSNASFSTTVFSQNVFPHLLASAPAFDRVTQTGKGENWWPVPDAPKVLWGLEIRFEVGFQRGDLPFQIAAVGAEFEPP